MNLLQRIARSESPKLERPFRALCGYVLQRTGLSDRICLRRSNYGVPFFARSNVALTLWVNPDIIDLAEDFARGCLKSGDTMIDVGANIGCVTAAGSLTVGTHGHVYAVEAHPRTFSHLQRTVEVNHCKNVTCLNVALGATAGAISFADERRKDDHNRVSYDGSSRLRVPCVRLDSLVQKHGISRIALLKVDVEGFEVQVLEGAESILNIVDCLYVEVLDHNLRHFGSSASEAIAFLRARGFSCHHFRDDQSNIVALSNRVSSARWQHELAPVQPDSLGKQV